MTNIFVLILAPLLMPAGSIFAQDYSAKPTVCSITLESNNEEQVFERALGTKNFNFVELVPPVDQKNYEWFHDACQSGVRCDVLIVSGHFGGTFFGKSGQALSFEDLEKNSCDAACPGILSNPTEVFLFGCNTLATKNQDYRTPQEYLHVLLDDGFSQSEAEQIVASRYGPYGDENKARMVRVFEGVKHIYGFGSVAPTGEHSRGYLENYVRSVGDYRAHLIEASHSNKINDQWIQAMRVTSAAQASGMAANPEAAAKKANICALYNESSPLANRLALARKLIADPDFMIYLPSLMRLFRFSPPPYKDLELQSILEQIRSDEQARTRLQALVNTTKTPLLKIKLAEFGAVLGWFNNEEARDILQSTVSSLLVPPIGLEAHDALCTMGHDFPGIGQVVYGKDLNPQVYADQYGIASLECIKASDPTISQGVASLLHTSYSNTYEIAKYFAAVEATDPTARNTMEKILFLPGADHYTRFAIWYFAGIHDLDTRIKLGIIDWLVDSSGIGDDAYLAADKSPDQYDIPEVRQRLVSLMQSEHETGARSAAFLLESFCHKKNNCLEPLINKAWISALGNSDEEMRIIASIAILDQGPSNDRRPYQIIREQLRTSKAKRRQAIIDALFERGLSAKDPKIAEIVGDAKPTPEAPDPAPSSTPPQPIGPVNTSLGPGTP